MKIANLLNRPRCFTLDNGDTLRLLSYEQREIKDSLVTKEMKSNVQRGLINLTMERKKPVTEKKQITKSEEEK